MININVIEKDAKSNTYVSHLKGYGIERYTLLSENKTGGITVRCLEKEMSQSERDMIMSKKIAKLIKILNN